MVIYKLIRFIKIEGSKIIVVWGLEIIRSSGILLGLYNAICEG